MSSDSKSDNPSMHGPKNAFKMAAMNGKKMNAFRQMQEKFIKSVSARLTVAQVVQNVQSGAEFTFDFSIYLLMAAWLAAIGLIENNLVYLVGSMLVSPMMGPLMALTFGSIIRDRHLRRIGMINMIIGFVGCIMFGFVFGLVIFNFADKWNPNQIWPSVEMSARGQFRSVLIGALIALPSGASVAISLLSGNQSLLWSFAVVKLIRAYGSEFVGIYKESAYGFNYELAPMEGYEWTFSPNLAVECGLLGLVSMVLALINVFCIFSAAYMLLKVKEVMPLQIFSKSPKQRFWSEHVKIARNYRRNSNNDAPESLGKELLEEWAVNIITIVTFPKINGLDAHELLSNKPEAKVTQLHTLQDILSEAEDDEVFQSIMGENKPNQNVCLKAYNSSPESQRRTSFLKIPRLSFNTDLESGSTSAKHEGNIHYPSQSDSRRASQQFKPEYSRRFSIEPSSVTSMESLTNSRGLDPSHLSHLNESNFETLQKSLKQADHLPFSLWPRHRTDADSSLDQVADASESASD